MDQLFEIDLELSSASGRSLSETLCRQLRWAIVQGRLPPGARLPATRQAARFFGVSRNTAAAVYEQLLSDGLVATRRGSGTYVAERPPAAPTAAARIHQPRLEAGSRSGCRPPRARVAIKPARAPSGNRLHGPRGSDGGRGVFRGQSSRVCRLRSNSLPMSCRRRSRTTVRNDTNRA